MKLATLATALISAGIATIITAKVVEKQMLSELDERVQRELEASVVFLETTGQAEPTEEYQEQHKQIFGTKFAGEKPSLDDLANKNQRTRYDQIIKGSGYSGDETVTADDGTVMAAEPQVEGSMQSQSELPDIHPISTDEFMENESGFMQMSVTYFADGGVLDEHGDVVADFRDMIGTEMPPFGKLSGEPHIVYLRNTRLRREIEVIHDPEANAADILADPGPGVVT